MDTYPVIKTFVIGLGSTGTRICDEVARRIVWELGGLERAPWVKFLCLETNANEASRFQQTGDFFALGMSPSEYQQMLEYPQAFDEKIALSQWAHLDTLRKLPGHDVSGGAGNIRMVGRLVFLHQPNYNGIKARVQERLEQLRHLTENQATEARGPLSDGSNPGVAFGAGNEVRIIVAGSLCGGTCSGIVSDFGFFLKSIARPGERVAGFFTIPRNDLAPAIQPKANCFKRNAYHALMKLNHYHLSGRDGTAGNAGGGNSLIGEKPIRVPDGYLRTDPHPYDLPYLAMPRQVGSDGERELNRAIGDRIFLNVFQPQTDPFPKAIDATIIDREHRAHVFCSFGLSTVEFPVQQVTEACSKRLLAHALSHWQSRSLEAHEQEARLNEIGLSWDALVDSLRQLPGGESLKQRLRQKHEDILRAATMSPKNAEEKLQDLRNAFSQQPIRDPSGTLPAGIVPHQFQTNRRAAAEGVLDRIGLQVRAHLLDYYDGPAPLQQVLQRVDERLSQLQAVPPTSPSQPSEAVDELFKQLRAYHRSSLLGLLLLKKPAVERLKRQLRGALEEETDAREAAEARRVFHTMRSGNTSEPGVLERISRLVKPVQLRTTRLRERVVALTNHLSQRSRELGRTTPLLNGICIFEPETTVGGTVPEEYERCLRDLGGDLARDWRETRELEAAAIIRAWASLEEGVVLPRTATQHEDWIMRDFTPQLEHQLIPERDLQLLEQTARRPFLPLSQVDVLQRWSARAGNSRIPTLEAQETAQKAQLFLDVSLTLAERGGRSPIVNRPMILAPASHRRDEFVQAARTVLHSADHALCPDRFRAILMQESFRFPLSGVPSILGSEGIHTAQCGDFPEFHTRMDVHWTGLSEEEVNALVEAEALVSLSVLLGIIRPQGGYLKLEWHKSGPADPGVRCLPLDIPGAARLIALERFDVTPLDRGRVGLRINGARELLRASIEGCRRSFPGEQRERDKAFVSDLGSRLQQRVSGPRGWDRSRIEEHIEYYCADSRDPALWDAYQEAYPPPKNIIDGLWRNKRDPRPGPSEGVCEEDGYYCKECGGLFGRDVREAARNGWRCYVDPQHVAFPRA